MEKITHFDLLELTKQETKLKTLLKQEMKTWSPSPKKETLNNLLSYSRALSIRSSSCLGHIKIVLN